VLQSLSVAENVVQNGNGLPPSLFLTTTLSSTLLSPYSTALSYTVGIEVHDTPQNVDEGSLLSLFLFFLPSHSSQRLSTTSASISSDPVPSKQVAYWLFGMCGLVGGMVSVGGITRLTRSGLSMTDWKLQGSLPPMNDKEWNDEFERYKQFPEWKQRQSMDMEEFKSIFWWEYGHRMLGRSLGVAFILPLTYFSIRGMIPKSLYPRMAGLLALGGGQVRHPRVPSVAI
jgi:hypothetical protein